MIKYAAQEVLLETPLVWDYLNTAFPRDWHGEHSPGLTAYVQFNYPWAPHLKEQFRVGDLYWPTGAQRWAQCWLMASTEQKTAIEGALVNGIGLLELEAGDGSIDASMYMLQPKQLSGSADRWLLPLVDQRYWWQFSSTAAAVVVTQGTTTWANVIAALKAQLSIATLTTATISTDYLYPDTETVTQYQGNAAALLDSVVNSIGMRVVVARNGDVALADADAGNVTLTSNLALPYKLVAGGKFDPSSAAIPSNVSVAYRERNFSTNQIKGIAGPYINVPDPAVFTSSQLILGPVKRIASACYADVTSAGFGNTPDNNTHLLALAAQISKDYYVSLTQQYEYAFNTLLDWKPGFFDDWMIWSAGSLIPGKGSLSNRNSGLRVRTYPLNYGPDIQLQQDNFPTITTPTNYPVTTPSPPVLRPYFKQHLHTGQATTADWAALLLDTNDYNVGGLFSWAAGVLTYTGPQALVHIDVGLHFWWISSPLSTPSQCLGRVLINSTEAVGSLMQADLIANGLENSHLGKNNVDKCWSTIYELNPNDTITIQVAETNPDLDNCLGSTLGSNGTCSYLDVCVLNYL